MKIEKITKLFWGIISLKHALNLKKKNLVKIKKSFTNVHYMNFFGRSIKDPTSRSQRFLFCQQA